jgi:putative mRNA 3-end processing factor
MFSYAPIPLHGALMRMCRLYQELGVDLGELVPATVQGREKFTGAIVLAPPSEIGERWARRLNDPLPCLASGWMRVRQRARQGGVELPLIISDHADWPELLSTCAEVEAGEIWVTHGREDALIHALGMRGIKGRALHLVGMGEDGEEQE